MKRSALVVGLVVVACGRHAAPPPPPPAPPGAASPPTSVAAAPIAPTPVPATTAPSIAGPSTAGPTTAVPTTALPTTGVPPTTAMAPVASGVTPPPTTAIPGMPTPSAVCQRASHCCGTVASRLPRGYPRRGHSPRELLMARDAQCRQALGMCAEAFMEIGERPPDYCMQPGRHAEPERYDGRYDGY